VIDAYPDLSLCDAHRAVYAQSILTTLDLVRNNNSMLYDPYKWDSSRENERQGSEQKGSVQESRCTGRHGTTCMASMTVIDEHTHMYGVPHAW